MILKSFGLVIDKRKERDIVRNLLVVLIGLTYFFIFSSNAQTITLSQLEGPIQKNTWQIILNIPEAASYHTFLENSPPNVLIDIQPATAFVNKISPFLYATSPIKSLAGIRIVNHKLEVKFDLRYPIVLSTSTIAGHPNQLVLTFIDAKLHQLPVSYSHLHTVKKILTTPISKIANLYRGKPPSLTSENKENEIASSLSVTKISEPKSIPVGFQEAGEARASSRSGAYIKYVSSEWQQQSQNLKSDGSMRKIVVVIDPGHGGKDPGATGMHGTHEKNIVLNISKKLQTLINQQPGFYAVLTRSSDSFIPLRTRLDIARRDKADMFVAIHADAYLNHVAHGASVYALSSRGATSEAARWLAKEENQSELMGGVDLSDKENVLRSVLINLSQTATIHASLLIGQNLLTVLHQFTPLHHRKVEQAAFVVLKSPDIPSLLVETGFISNAAEEQNLNNSIYQEKIAEALMVGIVRYFKQYSPPDTWLAAQHISKVH